METKENNDNNLEFRYSRTHRLESAPQIVKDYYSENIEFGKKGFFKFFFKNKSTKPIFFLVLALIAFYFVLTNFFLKENVVDIEGLSVELKAVILEDTVYCTLAFPDSEDFKNKEEFVIANFSIYDLSGNLINTDFDSGLYLGEKKYFRVAFPYFESKKVVCELDFCDRVYILKTDVN
jgi:hypothetical protein